MLEQHSHHSFSAVTGWYVRDEMVVEWATKYLWDETDAATKTLLCIYQDIQSTAEAMESESFVTSKVFYIFIVWWFGKSRGSCGGARRVLTLLHQTMCARGGDWGVNVRVCAMQRRHCRWAWREKGHDERWHNENWCFEWILLDLKQYSRHISVELFFFVFVREQLPQSLSF